MKKQRVDSLQFKLKMLRVEAGKSQEEFAQELGISRSALANYETGKRHPDVKILAKIASLSHVMLDFLLEHSQNQAVAFHESGVNQTDAVKQLMQQKENCLNITHLATEHKISLIEYYDYILSKHPQANKYNMP